MNERLYRTCFAVAVVMMSVLAVHGQISIATIGTYATGSFNTGAAEIADFDPLSDRIFFTNAQLNTVVALNASNPSAPSLAFTIPMAPYGAGVNSVTVLNGGAGIAVAVEASPKTNPGVVVFFDTNGVFLSQVTVGALPDMVTVSPNGLKVLVANEGEPNDTYTIDPIGSVSIIDISGGPAGLTNANVTTLDFSGFTQAMLPGVRIFGPGASVAQDMEPEYIAVSDDSQKAYVVCQENNAVARIDLATNTIEQVTSLGMKDHSLVGNGLDASDSPVGINIASWPVKGLYMPDAIDSYTVGVQTYVVYANEGDAREYGTAIVEPRRIGNAAYVLDPTVFPNATTLKQNANLGRLNATTKTGDTDGDGDFDEIHVFGSRSFSIRDANGILVYDSGDDFEQITADSQPTNFNSTNSANNSFDNRSDDKGPEPEAVVIGEVAGQQYAFIGLERIGGIMVYNVTDPAAPVFVQYLNNRNFAGNAAAGTALDLGVEGLTFVSASESPNGFPLVISSNEISGTVTIFQVTPPPPPCTLNEVTLTLTTDNNGAQTSWEILPSLGGAALCSGNGYSSNSTITASCCLPNGCYNLRIYDSFGDGMASGPLGGWVLRNANNERILDNANDGVFSGASVQAPDAFCLPIGTDRLTAATCDQEAVTSAFTLQVIENPIVTGQFGITNSLSGYQYWIYNPDGSYNRRVFLSHQNPGPSAPTGTAAALRASYLRLNTLTTNTVPSQVLLNVRVRARIAGAYQEFGPACRMKLDPTVNCQTTQLTTTANPVISCGASGLLLNGVDQIHANAVPGANRYQFRFTRPGFTRNIATNSRSLTLFEFTTNPLQLGLCYDVIVRASFDNGTTWCAFGPACEVCIGAPAPLTQRIAQVANNSAVLLWPNPNDGQQVNLSISGTSDFTGAAQVDVFDTFGRKVMGRTIALNGPTMNTSLGLNGELASGLYLVNITVGEETFTERMIIQP